ncbi:MAG: superoxide dismutase family protein [Spirochaetia bacterium]|nr:superoxide dismutase family protein [Spirochaetia bacterium]
MKKIFLLTIFTTTAFGFMAQCSSASKKPEQGKIVKADIVSKSGTNVFGTVKFEQISEVELKLTVELVGLKYGQHGFHIHENGDCSAHDAESAGGHWNPDDVDHGVHGSGHAGDLGNISADKAGNVFAEIVTKNFSLGGERDVIGKAVIIHEDPDDFGTQPEGNAGKRAACGVIK